MTKLYAQRKDVFDINKITIVGSPTITSDGVASGFSSGNYIKPNILSIDLTDNFKISFEITTSSDVITEQSVWGTTCNNQAFVCQIINGFFRLYYPTGTGQRGMIDFGNVEVNKKYNITLSCNNGTLTIQDYNKSFSFLGSVITFLYIGSGRYENQAMFTGSVNLKQFKIYVDEELVYSPTKPTYLLELRKEGFDLSKFTVVGSPTITDDGIASGFTAENYIKATLNNITYNNEFKLCFKVNFGADQDGVNVMTQLNAPGTTDRIVVYKESRGGNKQLVCEISVNGNTTWQPFVDGLSFNTEYNIELTLNQTNYTLSVFDTNGTLVKSHTRPALEGTMASLTNVIIGRGGSFSAFDSSIDLPSFSITVDGKEVFTGAKEKFYAMRGM